MKRLVYSPKVYAYVQLSDHTTVDGTGFPIRKVGPKGEDLSKTNGVYNISDYIVSGSVTRRINQPSSAELTIRNPNRMFTQPGNPTFYPMDKLTVFLQRLPGHSVQVFTGYLDETPYYQMYPGTCTLKATCTLKRLLYTYFDPALPFMVSFMREYGWIVDPVNGQLKSYPGQSDATSSDASSDSTTLAPATTSSTDQKVLLIGDSLGVGTHAALAKKLKKSGWKITPESEAIVGKPLTGWGLEEIKSLARRNLLPNTLIVQLGTNDIAGGKTAFKTSVMEVMDIADGRTVYWVNLAAERNIFGLTDAQVPGAVTKLNDALTEVAGSYANLHIIDYHSLVESGKVHLADGIHPYPSDYSKRVNLIVRGVSTGGGTSGTPSVSSTELAQLDISAYNAAASRDSSVAKLLYAVLNHIGNWDDREIWIEQLPDGLINSLAGIYANLTMENAYLRDALEAFLKGIAGPGSEGGGNTSGDLSSGHVAGEDKVIPILIAAANRFNLDPVYVINAAIQESGLRTDVLETASSQGNAQGDYGLFQQATYPNANFDPYPYPAMHKVGYGRDRGKYWTKKQATDPGLCANLFCAAAQYYVKNHPGADAKANWAELTRVVQGSVGYPNWSSSMPRAESLYNRYKDSAFSQITGDDSDFSTVDKSGSNSDNSTPSSDQIYAPIAGDVVYGRGWHESSKGVHGKTNTSGSVHWHSGVDAAVPTGTPCVAPVDGVITMATSAWSDGGMVHFKFTKDVGQIKKGTVIGWGHVTDIKVSVGDNVKAGTTVALSGNPGGGPHVHFIVSPPGQEVAGGDGSTDPTPLLTALQKHSTVPVDSASSTSDGSSSGGGNDAVSAAVATVFDLPGITNTLEAYLLPPDRSLMNDQPLLPFVEQLSKGSLRSFMSMPNGNFYGFFPDYFGSFGKQPYWEINDIEVLDGKIQLTDKNLATHVFIVGDTLHDSPQTEFVNALATAGVVSIMNAGSADFIQHPKKKATKKKHKDSDKKANPNGDSDASVNPFLGDLKTSLAFLRRYGARPYREDVPMLRSHYFELFVAFQTFMLMWSRQFLTTFTFTFMPEIYPGGIVQFTEHGLQMFVEEVTHTFDYSSGFTTQANLTASAAIDGTDNGYANGLVKAGVFASDGESE